MVEEEQLEQAAGAFGYPNIAYKSYFALVDKIYFGCNRLNVKPYCPQCKELLKPLVACMMEEEELVAAHEKGHVMCHFCHFEGDPDAWVFSANNHR